MPFQQSGSRELELLDVDLREGLPRQLGKGQIVRFFFDQRHDVIGTVVEHNLVFLAADGAKLGATTLDSTNKHHRGFSPYLNREFLPEHTINVED
jgi:hypothetical protein